MDSSGVARSAYDLAFQVSPIILVDGIAKNGVQNMLPIIALTGQLGALAQGVLTSGLSLDSFFARYIPIPGGTIISNTIGTYPFANQQVAANAVIQQPVNISLMMIAPVRDTGGYLSKLAIFTSLQQSLQQHNNAGGRYHIATPAYIYTDCLMTAMTDITSGETKQQQVGWQLDFVKPLVTQQQATAALNNQMSRLANGQQINPLAPPTTGPAQGITPSGVPGSYGSVVTYPYGSMPTSPLSS